MSSPGDLQDKIAALPDSRGLKHRLRRCLSWLERGTAERDGDAKCVFLWIAFNAAYAVDRKVELALSPADTTEAQRRSSYFTKLVPLDGNRRIYNVLATELRAPVQDLMRNVYVYWGFWDCLTEQPFDWRDWPNRARFERDRDFVAEKLGYGPASGAMQDQLRTNAVVPADDVIPVLRRLFDRLNVLRNQLMHGCATQDGSFNRSQVEAGAMILAGLVPVFLGIMAEEPRQDWGAIAYPRSRRHPRGPAQPASVTARGESVGIAGS